MKQMQPFKQTKARIFLAVTLVCSLPCLHAHAQLAAGVQGGYNKNYLVTNNANRAFTNYRSHSGFTVGIPVQYRLNDWLAVAMEPALVQKNYSQVRSGFFTGIYKDVSNTYLQLPLMAQFRFGGKQLKGFVNTGAYGAYWSASHISGAMPNILDPVDGGSGSSKYDYNRPYSYNEQSAFDKRRDKRLELGWITGLGISYRINKRYEVFSQGSILYSLTDQQKKYMINQVPRYNTTYSIQAGALMQFKMGKKTPLSKL